jgi:mannose-6-phosphate isomerase-like protein (cupin superfamily)
MDDIKQRPQRFTVSHLNEADFKGDGLRPYSIYRDLGIAVATHGLATAHVIRMVAPFSDQFRQRHHHDVQFQLVYVLKGWFKSEFEGEGAHVMKAGSCWIQPPGIRHTVLGWSDDCELLEIILPAEHATANDP